MRRGSSGRETNFVQDLVLYAARAAISCLVLFVGLRHLDPNRESSKKALQNKKEIAKRLGRPLVETNPYEDVIACDVINTDNIDVKFDCIGGLEGIKQALYDLVILPLRRPELFSHGKLLGPQKGVLLYGPPGTGKTMLAKAIAKESGAVFINVRISNLMSKWFGDAQKLVAAIFSLAHKLQPAIIFIDEVDGFLGQRKTTDHEALTNMKTEFMALWDGFTTDQNARVLVLAATNRPSELDEAILRRLPQAFEIGVPDCRERADILKVILKDERVEDGIDYDHVAGLCDGFTGSDLLELCKNAAYFSIRDLLNDEKNGKASLALSVARALSLRSDHEAQRIAGLEEEVDLRGKRIMDLEADRAKLETLNNELEADLRKAREEIGVAKDEAEDAKLELEAKTKEFEAAIEDARVKAVEDFKKSEDFGAMRGEYAMGSYNYAFKQARAFLRSRMPDVSPVDLVADPNVLDSLELSSSEATMIGGEDDSAAEDEVDRPSTGDLD